MGRKQKLRQEKRNIQNKTAAAAAAEVTAAAADDVKEKIFEKTGIPKKNQRLNFNRQPLLEKDDNKTRNDCGIKHDDILDLQPMEITVKAPDGRTTKLVVSPEDTIDDIKLQVNEKLAIPFVDQRPTFKGKALPEKSTLRSNNIGHGDTINLQPMEITVVAPDGRTINLVVSPDATIDYVKRQVNKRLKEKETVEVVEKAEALMNQFPKSDMYFQAMAGQDTDNISAREQYELLKEGATEDGCIHCMFRMGKMTMYTPDGKCMQIHLALPWFLEGAIRGSFPCMMSLMSECYYFKDEPNREKKTDALVDYWGKITKRNKLSDLGLNKLKHHIGRKCVICSKTDTKTLTLQQCIGCSFYCYCSETCQTIHWKERKHRNECKQLRILNKYHKPYAIEIRDAVIRGDKEIPSLEKLRYKLGLTRPQEEYEEFYKLKPTHNGNPIDPYDYLTGREDGTLWVGSVPNSPIGSSRGNTGLYHFHLSLFFLFLFFCVCFVLWYQHY